MMHVLSNLVYLPNNTMLIIAILTTLSMNNSLTFLLKEQVQYVRMDQLFFRYQNLWGINIFNQMVRMSG